MLNEEQKKKLLKIARETMETYIKEGRRLNFKEDDPALLEHCGAFVTLRNAKKKPQDEESLRGCIGHIVSNEPLYKTVRDMAIASSTEDPRFPPVTVNELKDIKIEISVLSTPKKIKNIDEFELGTHGVIIQKGFNQGVFLPQVATETGWKKEEFLSCLCSHKAGLPPDAWKDKDTNIYIFEAEVFEEN
ncbi:MAG: AmmeMemoRadiSam system protein A [Candidatus Ratteibacteria bacterium]|nr:AmmeMemoRadiSam system protein A [Candidatus Ratteibacteria bacterium]